MIRSRTLLCALAGCVVGTGLLGQVPVPPVSAIRFEVADVHRSTARSHPYVGANEARWNIAPGGRLFLRDATMVDLIAETYSVDPTSIFGGPSWLGFDRFDIFARMPPGSNREDARSMVRTLLAERFELAAHTGTRPLPAFALIVGNTPKLKQAQPGEDSECGYRTPPKDAPSGTHDVQFACHNVSMRDFAEFLHDAVPESQQRPIVDATGLKGRWDFDLSWTYQIPKDEPGTTIFAALERQLGLKLEPRTEPLPVVVVDKVNETPTPNVAGIEQLLPPPPPAEFEVATIRPANPEEKHFNIEIRPGGRVTIQHASLQTLIKLAWDIGDGKIVNRPKWLNDDLYDISGEASDPGTSLPGASRVLDIDEVKEMLRSLLAERFKMKSHMEDRPAEAFALLAAKPRMKAADPANHPSCKEGPGSDGKDPSLENPVLSRLISCQNMTMAQLTLELHQLVPGYLPAPVIDETGLTGAYDFTLSFSKSRDLVNPSLRAPGDGDSAASEPSGGISLYDAMQKQLGLRLEKRAKVPVAVLVIDHLDQKPLVN